MFYDLHEPVNKCITIFILLTFYLYFKYLERLIVAAAAPRIF